MDGSARPDPITAATSLVTEVFGDARAAILAGSVVTGHATAASDLDIVVVGDDPDAPFRTALHHRGWPAEVFVHTEASIDGFWRLPNERLRPALALMCARGRVIVDVDGTGARIQTAAQAHLAAGPPPLPPDEHERMRYALTDSLDDLVGGPRPEELPFIVATVTSDLCEVAMENRRAFRGTGKWMYRMADQADPAFAGSPAHALAAVATGDTAPLVTLARTELATAGGPLFDGYRASGKPLLDGG